MYWHNPPTSPTSSDYFIPKIKNFHYDIFHVLSGLNSQKTYGLDGVASVIFKNCAYELAHCLVKLFVCVSTSSYPCWKSALIQPVPKKGDHSNSSNYCPIALISCLSKACKSAHIKEIMRHLSAYNILSNCQYGFWKDWSTGDLAFLTESWSSSFRVFGETFAVSLDISKAFDVVWHKSLISKLSSHGFYPLCTFISSFLTDRSIASVVDGHCSSPEPIILCSMPQKLNFYNYLLDITFQITIPSSMTLNCTSLPHSTHSVYPLLKI